MGTASVTEAWAGPQAPAKAQIVFIMSLKFYLLGTEMTYPTWSFAQGKDPNQPMD